jgi:hypothetical protein
VRVSTREARSWTGLPTVPVFLAPGGSLPLATGRWQLTMRPFFSTEQVSRCFPPLAGAVGTGAGDGLTVGEGLGDALAAGVGVPLALATPLSPSAPAAASTITVDQRPMPDVVFRFNVDLLSGSDVAIARMTTLSYGLLSYIDNFSRETQGCMLIFLAIYGALCAAVAGAAG